MTLRSRIAAAAAFSTMCLPLLGSADPVPIACEADSHLGLSLASTSEVPGETIPAGATLVLRFANLSDSHILDDESSPVINGNYLETGLEPAIGNNAAQRLQEEYTDEVLNAMIETINVCDTEQPLELMIATGDLTDNMTLNELRRYIDNLDGVSAADTAYEANCGYTTHDSNENPKLGAGPCTPEMQAAFVVPTGKLVADSQANAPDPESPLDRLTPTRSVRQLADTFASSAEGLSHWLAPGLPPVLRCEAFTPDCSNHRLAIPHYAVFGNHDGSVRGTVTMQQPFQAGAAAVGRYFFESQREVINEFFFTTAAPGPVGHGFNLVEPSRFDDEDDRNDGWYAFDAGAGGQVRMIVLNTIYDGVRSELHRDGQTNADTGGIVTGNEVSNPIGLEQGVMSTEQFDWLAGELAAAGAASKPVLVFSHHPDRSFTDRRLGFAADGGKTSIEVDELLGQAAFAVGPNSYANTLVAWIAGHTHENVVTACRAGTGGCAIDSSDEDQPNVARGFWRVETSSLIDYPQEGRIVELWRLPNGGGYALKLTMIRPDPNDPTSNLSRRLSEMEATCTTSAILGGPASSGPYDQARLEQVLANAGEAAVMGNFCQGQASLVRAAGDVADRDVILKP